MTNMIYKPIHGQIYPDPDGGKFDITMGGFHGAEIWDLVGLYLLSQLAEILPKGWIGLYRDNGLAVSFATPRQVERRRSAVF